MSSAETLVERLREPDKLYNRGPDYEPLTIPPSAIRLEAAAEIEALRAARDDALEEAREAYWLRKNAVLVRELGNSMSPGALAAAMERRADVLDSAARALQPHPGTGESDG